MCKIPLHATFLRTQFVVFNVCMYIFECVFQKALLDYVKQDQSKGHALKQGLLLGASPWNLSGSGKASGNIITKTP